jgi:large subunit ribosomal protein L24
MQRLRVGDLVSVIAGRDKGKTGVVQRIFKNEQRVLVEGINKVTRHLKPSQRNQEGGRIAQEAPIHISNVMPIDADSGAPTRVKIVVDEEDGTKKRVAVSGAELKTG